MEWSSCRYCETQPTGPDGLCDEHRLKLHPPTEQEMDAMFADAKLDSDVMLIQINSLLAHTMRIDGHRLNVYNQARLAVIRDQILRMISSLEKGE